MIELALQGKTTTEISEVLNLKYHTVIYYLGENEEVRSFRAKTKRRIKMDNDNVDRQVEMAQDGCNEALGWLYERHLNLMFSAARKILTNEQDIEDAVSESYIKMLKYIKSYDRRKASFPTWLYNIVRNESLTIKDRLNCEQNALNPIYIDDDDESEVVVQVQEKSTLGRLLEKEKMEKVKETFQIMAEKHPRWKGGLKLFYMRFLKDMTYEEISNETGQSKGSIKDYCL